MEELEKAEEYVIKLRDARFDGVPEVAEILADYEARAEKLRSGYTEKVAPQRASDVWDCVCVCVCVCV